MFGAVNFCQQDCLFRYNNIIVARTQPFLSEISLEICRFGIFKVQTLPLIPSKSLPPPAAASLCTIYILTSKTPKQHHLRSDAARNPCAGKMS